MGALLDQLPPAQHKNAICRLNGGQAVGDDDGSALLQQSIQVTLPDDINCEGCILQVIQFMSNHGLNDPGGCYYHHCAELAIDG